MKKWILIGSVLIIIFIVFLLVGLSQLGPVIKNAVNTYGPQMTKTEVRLGDVSISLFSGEAKLKDFFLGNPGGFKSPQALSVGATYVDVDEGSLTGDTIIIDKIEVVRPEITYEKRGRADNFKTISNNVKGSVGRPDAAGKPSGEKSEGKKLLIKNFIVRDGKVNLVVSMLAEKSISASLPDIHLKNVGNRKEGVAPAEAFKEIFAALHAKIVSPTVTDTLDQELKDLGLDVKAAGESAKKELEAVTGKVKGLLGK
jgi:uncharacterized protein involved in outer membrane biogenesis